MPLDNTSDPLGLTYNALLAAAHAMTELRTHATMELWPSQPALAGTGRRPQSRLAILAQLCFPHSRHLLHTLHVPHLTRPPARLQHQFASGTLVPPG